MTTATVSSARMSRREFLYYIWGASIALLGAQGTGLLVWFLIPRFREGEFGGRFKVRCDPSCRRSTPNHRDSQTAVSGWSTWTPGSKREASACTSRRTRRNRSLASRQSTRCARIWAVSIPGCRPTTASNAPAMAPSIVWMAGVLSRPHRGRWIAFKIQRLDDDWKRAGHGGSSEPTALCKPLAATCWHRFSERRHRRSGTRPVATIALLFHQHLSLTEEE